VTTPRPSRPPTDRLAITLPQDVNPYLATHREKKLFGLYLAAHRTEGGLAISYPPEGHREGGLQEACSKGGSPEDPLDLEGGLDLGGPFVISGTSGYPLNLKIFQ
jgi:hypothetical protein